MKNPGHALMSPVADVIARRLLARKRIPLSPLTNTDDDNVIAYLVTRQRRKCAVG